MYFLLRKKVDFNKHKCPLKTDSTFTLERPIIHSLFFFFFLIPAPAFYDLGELWG